MDGGKMVTSMKNLKPMMQMEGSVTIYQIMGFI